MVKPAHYGWQYGYYNDREAFPVNGPGVPEHHPLFKFASPQIAEQMCGVLQAVYLAGAKAAKDEVRAVINSNQ